METSGLSPFRTTGSASSRNTPNAYFKCSSGFTPARSIRARASGWPYAEKSWNATGERFGWNHSPDRDRHFCLRFAGGGDGEMNSRTIEILLVEDNPGDARLTLEAFKEGKVVINLTVVGDGVEALAYLRRQGQYANSVQPDLILLDLNLPKKDGREVLAEIKADERLMKIPVIVLTTSAAEEDI